MSASLLGWILTLIILVLLVYSVLMGVKRGLGKSLFRLIWLVVFAVIMFFITPVIARALNSIDISTLNLDIYGDVRTLNDIGTNLVYALAESNAVIATSETLITIAQALPAMIISIPLYVLLFFVTKWLLWPIWAVIASRFFDKQKRAQKKFKKEQARLKKLNTDATPEEMPIELTVTKKKNRLGGAVIGLVTGLVLSIVVFMPLIGFNSIYQNVATIKVTKEDGTQVGLVENSIEDPNVVEYLSFFENSVASKVLTYTGVGFVSNAMFGYLTTTQVDNQKISISSEVSTLAKVYDNVSTLMNFENGDLSQTKLDKTLTAAKELLVKVKDSTLVNVLGDDILPLLIRNYLDQEDLYIIDGGDFDQLIINSYNSYERKFNIQDLENQLENLVDVFATLNNANLIVPIANGTVKSLNDVISLVGTNITAPNNFTNTIVNKLYEVTLFSNSYPQLLENAVKSLFNAINNPEVVYDDFIIEREPLKESLRIILSNFINFASYYNQAENYDFGSNTVYAFESLGNTVDALKANILGESNYRSLLEGYAVPTLNDVINNALGDFATPDKKANSEKLVKSLLNSLTQVETWGGSSGELYAINTLYSKVIKVANTGVTEEKFLDPTYTDIEQIGEGITSAMRGDSKIVTNANLRRILEILLDKLESSNNESLNEILNLDIYDQNSTTVTKKLRNFILDNIYVYANGGTGYITASGWTNEFKYNVGIFKEAYKILTNQIPTETLTSTNDKTLQNIGASLDKAFNAKANLIFTNATMRGIVEYYLNKIELPEKANEIFNATYLENNEAKGTVKNQVLKNIYNPELKTSNVTSWEQEFLRIKNLLGADFENTEISALGKVLDGVLGSRIFTRQVINSVVIENIDDGIANNGLNYLNTNGGIDAMKNNLAFVTSYEEEFKNLKKLIDVIEATKEDSEKVKLRRIGEVFDEITNVGVNEALGSKMLTTAVVNEFVRYYFNDYINSSLAGDSNAKLREVVSKILDNLNNINDYSRELENIVNIADVLKDDTKTLVDIGTVLDLPNIKTSKLISTTVIRNLVNYFVDEKTANISEEGLLAIIETLKTNVANENVVVDSYAREFDYLQQLTESVNKNPVVYSEVGVALDKIRGTNSSRLINQNIVNELITFYFDKFKNNANFDAEQDAELIAIVDNIKLNIPKIASYEKELTNLENLFNVVNSSDNLVIGEELDKINGKSNLITRDDINNIVLYYFNKQAKTYETTYESIISQMREKLIGFKSSVGAVYKTCFTDLLSITTAFSDFDSVSNLEAFTENASNVIGEKLDQLEKITSISDRAITKEMANKVIDKLQTFANTTADETLKEKLNTAIEGVLTNETFDFVNYNTDNFNGNYAGETYYKDLFNSLYSAIEQAKTL